MAAYGKLTRPCDIYDDTFVFGKYGARDIALEATFRRLRENNLTLNRSKCLFNANVL